MGVEFMYVQRVSSLVHVRVLIVCVVGADEVAVDLNGLGSVAFLGIELAAVHTVAYVDRLDEKSSLLLIMVMGLMVPAVAMVVAGVSLLGYHGLSCWIETKVGLGHQLLIEGSIDTSILIEVLRRMSHQLNISSLSGISSLITSLPAFEQFGQDTLLLLVNVMSSLVSCLMNAQTFSLNRVVELSLTLSCGVLR